MTKKELYKYCTEYFLKNAPSPETELNYSTPFELLVAVILSAQCTDKRINMVTPKLFEAYPDALAMSKASVDDIFELIKSVTFPNNKAKHLSGMSNILVNQYHNEVPKEHAQLTSLPGVGRKTANVIVSVLFDTPAIAVDTHVFRVSQRIGLVTKSTTPLQVETQLTKHIPKALHHDFHHWLILHGRYTCTARSPKCPDCGLVSVCRYKEKNL